MIRRKTLPRWSLLVLALGMVTSDVRGQATPPVGEWRTYGGDLASRRYAPLDQITQENFKDLRIAWQFKTDNLGPTPEFNLQSTPLMANGVLYSTAGTRRAVVALNAATGELRWAYSVDEGARGAAAPRLLSGRGLAYWTDGQQERIVYVTPGYRLIALDAKIGRPIATFGDEGVVDLKRDTGEELDPVSAEVGYQSAPVIANDVIIVGAAHREGGVPKSRKNVKGVTRGYDVRTGRLLWVFRSIPLPGEPGAETWERNSSIETGNGGAWAQITVDEELGHVYVPTEMATGDFYGGHRPGAGLFTDSLVALDLKTGRRIWHQQLIHHDLWDWDIPCAPILADIVVDGKRIKAIAQATKQGWVYVFDRVTGQPVWPIDERPVPGGDVPGEWYSPTQPIPTKPPPFERQGVSVDDLIDFTPELRARAVASLAAFRTGPVFTPPVVKNPDRPLASLILPHETGGANWPGASYDPETGFFYVFSQTVMTALALTKDPRRSDMDFVRAVQGPPEVVGQGDALMTGLPLVKPPYGRITAIDLNAGRIAWQIAHGETPDYIRDHPALRGIAIPRTGRPGRIGTLATKTLLIAGESGTFTNRFGEHGAMLRAYDKATGREVGEVFMPAPQTGSPMTYLVGGRQYIVVAVSSSNYSGALLAFSLPY